MFLAGIHISFTFLTEDGVTIFYIGGVYEKNINTGEQTKYYTFGGERVAMRDNSGVKYFHSDHLGSAALTTDSVPRFIKLASTPTAQNAGAADSTPPTTTSPASDSKAASACWTTTPATTTA